jgi:flagellar motility protein MotE (MotC chaperone)
MNSNFRILPLLILVAMMAFSVRIADMVVGVSGNNGTAMAEEKAAVAPAAGGAKTIAEQIAERKAGNRPDEEKEKAPDMPAPPTMSKDDDLKVTQAPDVDVPEMKWRDASEQELEYAGVRMELFEELTERRKKMDKREKEIMTREALLRAAEQELDRKYQELSNLRTDIEGLLKQQSDEENARIASLVKIYEGMKPKDAARIFDTLDLDVLLAVMGKMSERKLSPVLAAMNPERARTITIMLAEQKKLPELPFVE